jgi:hypothetical protein
MHYSRYEILLYVKRFYANRERCEVLTGHFGLTVTGRTRNIGQNVLRSSLRKGSSSSPSYCHILLLPYRIPRGGLS